MNNQSETQVLFSNLQRIILFDLDTVKFTNKNILSATLWSHGEL